MQMVYSGYTLFFGSTCDYTKSDNYFRYAQGQAFIDGRQNGWMDLGLFKPEYKEKVSYLKQCGKYRMSTLKYLVNGQLLDPVIPIEKIAHLLTMASDGECMKISVQQIFSLLRLDYGNLKREHSQFSSPIMSIKTSTFITRLTQVIMGFHKESGNKRD